MRSKYFNVLNKIYKTFGLLPLEEDMNFIRKVTNLYNEVVKYMESVKGGMSRGLDRIIINAEKDVSFLIRKYGLAKYCKRLEFKMGVSNNGLTTREGVVIVNILRGKDYNPKSIAATLMHELLHCVQLNTFSNVDIKAGFEANNQSNYAVYLLNKMESEAWIVSLAYDALDSKNPNKYLLTLEAIDKHITLESLSSIIKLENGEIILVDQFDEFKFNKLVNDLTGYNISGPSVEFDKVPSILAMKIHSLVSPELTKKMHEFIIEVSRSVKEYKRFFDLHLVNR